MPSTDRYILLASGSPRRRALIGLTGLPVEVTRAEIDETPYADETARSYTVRLSQSKAQAAAHDASPQAFILAADTTVADGDDILGKPSDVAAAQALLRRLRGRVHQVYTALTLLDAATGQVRTEVGVTDVPMRDYSDAEIDAYIATGDPFDKAGGYAIQHNGFRPVNLTSGCFANVVGLPLCHLVRALRAFGVDTYADVPAACQAHFDYECDVSARILTGVSGT